MLPFIIGMLTGAAAMRTVQKKLPAQPLHKAGQALRDTGVAGLGAIERSSARLRNRLEHGQAPRLGNEAPTSEAPDGEPS